MGASSSNLIVSDGTLPGAVFPVPASEIPVDLATKQVGYKLTNVKVPIPRGIKPGMSFTANIQGKDFSVTVPQKHQMSAQQRAEWKERHLTVQVNLEDTSQVYASSMPNIPGMKILQSKQIIWGSVSRSYVSHELDQQSSGKMVGELMTSAQTSLLAAAVRQNCNAVLNISFNITNDSSGDDGQYKSVIVTCCGTPCIVVPANPAATHHQ